MRLTLDADILVYAFHADDPRSLTARDVVTRALRADCVQTLQSLGEFFNVLVRRRKLDAGAIKAEMDRIKGCVPIIAAQPVDLDDAVWAVMQHRFAFWDALLWATARRAGCRLILSEDMQDGRDVGGVRIVNPLKPDNRDVIDFILPHLE
jgi:predicted nucleic acid-binding protein